MQQETRATGTWRSSSIIRDRGPVLGTFLRQASASANNVARIAFRTEPETSRSFFDIFSSRSQFLSGRFDKRLDKNSTRPKATYHSRGACSRINRRRQLVPYCATIARIDRVTNLKRERAYVENDSSSHFSLSLSSQ